MLPQVYTGIMQRVARLTLISLFSTNKISDSSRKFLLSYKEKLKQSEENRASGWCLFTLWSYIVYLFASCLFSVMFIPNQLPLALHPFNHHPFMAVEQELKITHKHIPYWTGKYYLTFFILIVLLSHVLLASLYSAWYYCNGERLNKVSFYKGLPAQTSHLQLKEAWRCPITQLPSRKSDRLWIMEDGTSWDPLLLHNLSLHCKG